MGCGMKSVKDQVGLGQDQKARLEISYQVKGLAWDLPYGMMLYVWYDIHGSGRPGHKAGGR